MQKWASPRCRVCLRILFLKLVCLHCHSGDRGCFGSNAASVQTFQRVGGVADASHCLQAYCMVTSFFLYINSIFLSSFRLGHALSKYFIGFIYLKDASAWSAHQVVYMKSQGVRTYTTQTMISQNGQSWINNPVVKFERYTTRKTGL